MTAERTGKPRMSLLLLGLCPLLAVTDTVIKASALALVMWLAFLITAVTMSVLRRWLRPEIEIPASVMLLAGFVTACELAANAWAHPLYLALGIYLPLVTAHGLILMQVRTRAVSMNPMAVAKDALLVGAGQALVFILLGAFREALGFGALFHDAGAVLGAWGQRVTLTLLPFDSGWLLAASPPGAFIALGLLIAAGNWFAARRHGKVPANEDPPTTSA